MIILAACMVTSCNSAPDNVGAPTGQSAITRSDWGNIDGRPVYLYRLQNKNGTVVTITNFGGTITSFITADKHGNASSIIIGFDSLRDYLRHPPYFGAIIGRYGNRIGNGHFSLDGVTYRLAANNGKNHLHGGIKGFDKVVWDPTVPQDSIPSLLLKYISKDGEEGYPGNLTTTVQYTLTDEDALRIDYTASTDRATPVNLTNHSYFNLSGDVSNTILNESLSIDADYYTPVDSSLIPTGRIDPVRHTPFDFSVAKIIGRGIDSVKGGYDHNWVLNKKDSGLQKVAVLSDTASGRTLEVFTTQPGLQFYTGNFLDGQFNNRDGKPVKQHSALCLETQHFPDSPNKPNFPTTILRPGDLYHSVTVYKVLLK